MRYGLSYFLTMDSKENSVVDLIEQIRQQDDVLDELAMAAELAVVYRDERAFTRLREALVVWRNLSRDPR